MKSRILIAAVVSLVSISGVAEEQRGAKAIFVDTTSDAVVAASRPQPGAKPKAQKQRRSAAAKPAAAPVATASPGLKHYIELVSPSGERSQVTPDHTFRSGDRILLHVQSNVDGHIEVYQRGPDGMMTRLFPDERINGGSAFIRKGADTILPSPTAWFRFDDQAGIEQLTLILTPAAAVPSTPWQPTTPAQAAHDAIQGAAGSKGLLIETDNSGPQPATYAVARPGAGNERLTLSILLKHQ